MSKFFKNDHILYMMWKECVYPEYETIMILYFLGESCSKSLSLSLSLSLIVKHAPSLTL